MKAGIPGALPTSDKILEALQDKTVRKAVAEIADEDGDIESRIKCAVDDALTGNKVRLTILAAVADALTKPTMVDSLVDALKDHEGYK